MEMFYRSFFIRRAYNFRSQMPINVILFNDEKPKIMLIDWKGPLLNMKRCLSEFRGPANW